MCRATLVLCTVYTQCPTTFLYSVCLLDATAVLTVAMPSPIEPGVHCLRGLTGIPAEYASHVPSIDHFGDVASIVDYSTASIPRGRRSPADVMAPPKDRLSYNTFTSIYIIYMVYSTIIFVKHTHLQSEFSYYLYYENQF